MPMCLCRLLFLALHGMQVIETPGRYNCNDGFPEEAKSDNAYDFLIFCSS